MGPAGHLHVEARVVNQNQHVGGEGGDILPALEHLAADGSQVAEHLHDAEERGLAVVLRQGALAARTGHPVAAPEAELRFGVGLPEAADKVCAVEVARRLPGNKVVFHKVFMSYVSIRCSADIAFIITSTLKSARS